MAVLDTPELDGYKRVFLIEAMENRRKPKGVLDEWRQRDPFDLP